jgi:hypothetical protein
MPIGSKEFDLLCACARVEITPQVAARIADAVAAAPDWTEFLRLADHHGVIPLVARALREQGGLLPSEFWQSLRQAEQENLRRNLWFSGELARILAHFEKSGLRAVPYKGPVLAESVYGDLALRNFSDLDFLISPMDYEKTLQALAEIDYRPSEPWSPSIERFWRKYGYERAFDGKAGKYLVEVQWALLPYFNAVDLRNDDLLGRSRRSLLNGREVASLTEEDSLLVLCLHAGKHLWMNLLWVCDIAESMRAQTIDYAAVVKRARELGTLRMLGVSFWLAANLVGVELSPVAQEVVANDSEVATLGKVFVERIAGATPYDFESKEYFLLSRRLRERPADRRRYLWRLVWTPGVGDLAAVELPEFLFPLYRVVRFGRLLRKLASVTLADRQ